MRTRKLYGYVNAPLPLEVVRRYRRLSMKKQRMVLAVLQQAFLDSMARLEAQRED